MDIAILAGGRGTRLKGIWGRPKCLVPYQGRPLIEYLVNKVCELNPRKIFLLLGHKAWEVVRWREDCCPHQDLVPVIETVPNGTASAIRNALPFFEPPLLVMNGDTIPQYHLKNLVSAFDAISGYNSVAAWVASPRKYAGACLLNAYTLLSTIGPSEETDLDSFLLVNTIPIFVDTFNPNGFIDVGTPEGIKQAWRQPVEKTWY